MNRMSHMSKEKGEKKKPDGSDHGENGAFSDNSADSGDELLSPSEISGDVTKQKT